MNYKITYFGLEVQFWESEFYGEYMYQMNPKKDGKFLRFETIAIWKIKSKK